MLSGKGNAVYGDREGIQLSTCSLQALSSSISPGSWTLGSSPASNNHHTCSRSGYFTKENPIFSLLSLWPSCYPPQTHLFQPFFAILRLENVLWSCKMTSSNSQFASEHIQKGTRDRTSPLSQAGTWQWGQSNEQSVARREPPQAGWVPGSLGAFLCPSGCQTYSGALQPHVLARHLITGIVPTNLFDDPVACPGLYTPKCYFNQFFW